MPRPKYIRLLALFTQSQVDWLKSQNKPITQTIRDLIPLEKEPTMIVFKGPYMPELATKGSSGYDLKAQAEVTIPPGKHAVVPTGISVQIPEGYEGQVRSRSGLAAKKAVFVLNSPGTIDSDYRGEIKVILMNLGEEEFKICIGDRIAQIVFCPISVQTVTTGFLNETSRGDGGFGSSGV